MSRQPFPDRRRWFQFGLCTVLILVAISALWIFCTLQIGSSQNLKAGYVLVPVVLLGMTAAIQRVLPRRESRWLIAAAIAPVVAIASILLAFVCVGR